MLNLMWKVLEKMGGEERRGVKAVSEPKSGWESDEDTVHGRTRFGCIHE